MDQSSEIVASEPLPDFRSIAIIDPDTRRRAELARQVSAVSFTFPVESVTELATFWPTAPAILLVYDEGNAISELVEMMSSRASWLPFIGVHADPAVEQVVEAIEAGASDYWKLPVTEAIAATRIRKAGGRAKAESEKRAREVQARKRLSLLTVREREVISALTMGYSNKEIAASLGISPRTVEIHRANMKDRIDVRSTAEAVRLVVEAGLN